MSTSEIIYIIAARFFSLILTFLPFLSQLINAGIIIIIIVVVRKNKEKRQQEHIKKRYEVFTKYLSTTLKLFREDKAEKIFEEIYDLFLSNKISSEKDILLKKIPTLRVNYLCAVSNLIELGEDNSVLFCDIEQEKKLEEKYDFVELKEKYSQDIIKTIPPLIDFIEAHNELVLGIYKYLEEIVLIEFGCWREFQNQIEDFQNGSLALSELKEANYDYISAATLTYEHHIIERTWNIIKEDYPQFNNDVDHSCFIEFSKKEDLLKEWLVLYYKGMTKTTDKKGYLSTAREVYDFLHEVCEKFDNPSWLKHPTMKFYMPSYSSLLLQNVTEIGSNELMRIRKLYIDDSLKGKYSIYNDPNTRRN
ncbi:MAG: hypothetical protein E7677_02555 [Ruminococcaceae bacterium]|nr:hypothetical protein [Oscillospiraceae bacterium]